MDGLHRETVSRIATVNVEPLDRVIRIVVGIALLATTVLLESNWRWAGLIGMLPLASGIVGWCPIYDLFARD